MNTTLGIKEFELQNLCEQPKICIIGKRASGKSWLVKSILEHYKDIRKVVICPSEKYNAFYSDHFDNVELHHECTEYLINNLLNGQKDEQKELVCVLDDCLFTEGLWNSEALNTLMTNNKFYKITLIMTMQSCLGIKEHLRDQFDYVFSLKISKITEQKKLWDHYFGIFPTLNAFQQVFTELTKDYGTIVVDDINQNDSLSDTVFYYRVGGDKRKRDAEEVIINNESESNYNYLSGVFNFVKSCICLRY